MIYTLIAQVQQKASIVQACRALQVSRAGYYAAKARARQPANCPASVQVKAAFEANQHCYGSRRIVDELQAQDIMIGSPSNFSKADVQRKVAGRRAFAASHSNEY